MEPLRQFSNQRSVGPFLDLPQMPSVKVGAPLNLWAAASRPVHGFIVSMNLIS